jgi:DNA-binding CsgD family transcriptional regulator
MTTEISTRYSASISEMKARQSLKIREFESALIKAGHTTLDQQARVLGLSRATTWTLLKGGHKSSGLSATIINRMLETPYLPSLVQAKIIEYVQEKIAGLYGHNKTQVSRFAARLRHRLPARSSATRR